MPFAQKTRILALLLLASALPNPAQAGFFDDVFGGRNPFGQGGNPFGNPFGGRPQPQPEEEPAPVVMGKPKPVIVGPFSAVTNAASIQESIRASLADKKGSLKIGKQPSYVVKEIASRLYSLRDSQPLFVDANGPTAVGAALRDLFLSSGNVGLQPAFYWGQDAETIYASKRDVKSLAELDLLMAMSYMQYANDIATGRTNPQDASQNIVDIEFKKRSFAEYAGLNQIAASPEALVAGLQSLEPVHPIYLKMKASLTRLLAVKRAGGWPRISLEAQLNPGRSARAVPAIRARMAMLGLLPAEAEQDASQTYDAALVAAVRNFQEGAKLQADGQIGNGTLKALDVSIDSRIRQLQVNIERYRLLPKDFGPNHIFVDLGRQHLRLVQNGVETLSFKTVVGQTLRQTPSFPDEVAYIIVNPYWFAPGSIVVKDILPQVMQNPDYFSMLKMKVLQNGQEIDTYQFDPDYWAQFTVQNPPPYTFREDPGPANSLGRIKLQLTKNKHDIYMHDTNHPELFNNLLRTHSSGCIRMERPVDMAAALLSDQGVDVNSLDAMIADETVVAKKMYLKAKMPVYVMGTTIALKDGALLYGPDIYGQDKRIMDAINGLRIVPTAETMDFFGDRDSTL